MNKYFVRILVGGTIVAVSIALSVMSLVPTYVGVVTIAVSWLLTLYYVIRYIFAWYKKDLIKRVQEQDIEEDDEDREKPTPMTSLLE